MKTKTDYKSILIEINILTIAIAIIAVAVYFFLVPSHTSISSMSGLGIVLSNFVPLPLSAITMILNVVLLIIGFFTCGKEFGLKTVYTSVMLPVFLAHHRRGRGNAGAGLHAAGRRLPVYAGLLLLQAHAGGECRGPAGPAQQRGLLGYAPRPDVP